MPGLIDKPPAKTSTSPSPERRRSRLAAWLAALRSRLAARPIPTAPGGAATEDPITAELQATVQAAFPRPNAADALRDRVAGVYRPPEAAPAGDRQGPPSHPRTRNGLQPGDWGHVRPRWGWVGVALVVLAAIGLSMRREHDVLAEAIRAMEAAPVIHVVAEGRNGRGVKLAFEGWILRDQGFFGTNRWDGQEVQVVLDDRKQQYDYSVSGRRLTIKPSEWRDPKRAAWMRAAFTGVGLVEEIRKAHRNSTAVPVEVERNGKRLKKLVMSSAEGTKSYFIDAGTGRLLIIEDADGTGVHLTWLLDYPAPATIDHRRFRIEVPPGVNVRTEEGAEPLGSSRVITLQP
jgi:hypothetical protein